jgi:uncharacterized membrane protein (GlpM family)
MMSGKLRDYENFHIVLWLLKDSCWVMEFKIPGLIMIIPTIAVAIHITWLHRQSMSELYHNLAIVSWITANSVWMIGEFFFKDTLRPVAAVFFVIGLLLVSVYYFVVKPRLKKVE